MVDVVKEAKKELDEFFELVRRWDEGIIDSCVVLKFIDESKYIRKAFVKWVIEQVEDNLCSAFSTLYDSVDYFGYFKPFNRRLDAVLDDFAKAMELRGVKMV